MPNHLKNMLASLPNPHKNKLFTISITREVMLDQQIFLFGLRYIPDKLLLDHGGLSAYLENILIRDRGKPETLAHNIVEDVMNQIIPRWVEINLKQKSDEFGQTILITTEGRQPGWENDAVLNRLPPLLL